MKRQYEKNNTTIRLTNKVKSLHPVFENIANNLSEIDVINRIRIAPDFLQESSESTGGQQKNPVTQPGHPTAIGVALILDTDHEELQFFEMTSEKKGYGKQMVDATLRDLPSGWRAIVMMDWSDGFWDRMKEKHHRIELV